MKQYLDTTGDKISERFFFAARTHFFLQKINTNLVFTQPPGSQLAPWPYQIVHRVSADPMDVRNNPQEGPRPQAISRKKKWVRAKKRLSEILLPVVMDIF